MAEPEKPDRIKIWDRTRSGIESFDRYIADVRKFYLTVLFAIVALAPAFARDQPPSVIPGLALVIGFVLVLFTIVFWELDTYYGGFLKVAAWTARRLEKELNLVADHKGLTAELSRFADEGAIGRWMFHLMYFVPLFLAWISFSYGAWTTLSDWPGAARIFIITVVLVVALGSAYVFMGRADAQVNDFLKSHLHPDEPDPTRPPAAPVPPAGLPPPPPPEPDTDKSHGRLRRLLGRLKIPFWPPG